jgi:biotin operon repressor
VDAVIAIADPKVAAHLLDPLRARLLHLGREPLSASQFAEKIGLQRQRVNYHVKQLRDAGLLVESGRREKRNLTEVLYQASAFSYLIDPAALGPLAPKAGSPGVVTLVDLEVRLPDASTAHALASDIQSVITRLAGGADVQGTTHRLAVSCYHLTKPMTP